LILKKINLKINFQEKGLINAPIYSYASFPSSPLLSKSPLRICHLTAQPTPMYTLILFMLLYNQTLKRAWEVILPKSNKTYQIKLILNGTCAAENFY
jgi:hypothetical protein